MKRRSLLIGTGVIAGSALLVGVVGSGVRDRHFAQQAKGTAKAGETLLGGWVKIATDGTTTVMIPHCDMGQGTHTALAMMLAEELDADWTLVRAERAPARTAFANRFLVEGYVLGERQVPKLLGGLVGGTFAEAARLGNVQATGGSLSVRTTGQFGMRVVGAAARSMLMQAAAANLNVPLAELSTASGRVLHATSGRSVGYGELALAAAEFSAPTKPELKLRANFRIIGTSPPRFDIAAKATGKLVYSMDLQLPHMRMATVMAAPVHGGTLLSVDQAPAKKVAGVEHIVTLPNAVIVIAKGYWQARQGLLALQPQWGDAGRAQVSTATLKQQHKLALEGEEGDYLHKAGDAAGEIGKAAATTVVEAYYDVPFLHHMTMEPVNVTAQWEPEKLTVWTGEQDALGAMAHLVKISGMKEAQIELIAMPMGGGFGRRSPVRSDHLVQALAAAKQVAPHPVKLIWSREEDFAQGSYRPMLASHNRATLDANGNPHAWDQRSIDTPGLYLEGFELPYRIAHQAITKVPSPSHIMFGTWRSVGYSQNGFYTESFIDELAHAAKRDPFEYRRELLGPQSRQRKVLEEVARLAGWANPVAAGHGRGIALVESFGSIVAMVIEVSTPAAKEITLHRVTTVVDCGMVVHPNTARQQVEGAIIMGLSAALGEAITIERGAVVQRNLPDYAILKLAGTPRIDVHFLTSDGPVGGMGEVGLPPVAPALANAVFAASGVRQRSLPFHPVAA